jgi:micrococcal nuclease
MSSRTLMALVVLAAILLARFWPAGHSDGDSHRSGDRTAAVVTRVVDGDTIHVRTARDRDVTVRLLGIDTPETHRPNTPVECGGPQASASMARLAPRGTRVTLAADPTQDRMDRYGRTLAYVFLSDGRLLEDEQLRSGWAGVYVFHGNPVRRIAQFRRDARAAQSAHRGVWAECGGDFHSAAGGG